VVATSDIYISADIEADGPIPGVYSMLSFGFGVAATFDGSTFVAVDAASRSFYRELQPMTEECDRDAVRASGLDREELRRQGTDPAVAMHEAADWVAQESAGFRPVLVGYPVVFDWMFLHWYFVHFVGKSPFGFSSALDMKTIYQQKAGVTIDKAGRTDLPAELRSDRRHTHNALDDALEQAEIFNKLFVWPGRR
jgi:hypothetical protein